MLFLECVFLLFIKLSAGNGFWTGLLVDKEVSKSFTPFTKFPANENEIRHIHLFIAPDLSLADLAVEFQEL